MSLRIARAVARWEYERFAKPKDLFIGTLFFALMFGVFDFARFFMDKKESEEKTIVVAGAETLGFGEEQFLDRFRLEAAGDRTLETLQAALHEKKIDAILDVSDSRTAELRVLRDRGWHGELLLRLQAAVSEQRLAESDLDPAQLAALLQPMEVSVVHQSAAESGGRAGSLTVLIVVGTMLLALFIGFSYVFVAITGEKTQKVTESILAAITPQEWIDGKILGLIGVIFANLVCYGLGYLLAKAVGAAFFDRPFALPSGIEDPVSMMWVVLFSLFGFGFWLTLFSLVAATISDPNTSSRSSMMMLPFLPLGLLLVGMDHPDTLWMRVLALIPGLSPTAMPIRLLRGEPHWMEVILSLLLLALVTAMFRRAAGKVFGVSMLMTGKEPSFREVWRWARS